MLKPTSAPLCLCPEIGVVCQRFLIGSIGDNKLAVLLVSSP
jgi:hypothetical protein